MNILAVDTTTKDASVSLKTGGAILSYDINNEITHSEKLLPLIDKTLTNAGLTLKDIDKFALINGPGSFTGIRIGLSTLKAFSHTLDKDIFSISSLELIALSSYLKNKFEDEKYIATLIDAKNDRVYYSVYKVNFNNNNKLNIENLMEIKNDIIDDALEAIKDALEKYNLKLEDIVFAGTAESKPNDLKFHEFYPTTEDLLEVMEKLESPEKYTYNAFNLKAIYARPSQAERVKNGEK